MKLIELNPEWVGNGGESVTDANGNPVPRREGVAVDFDCPCGCDQRLCVVFANPLDGGPSVHPGPPRWTRTGETFEDLDLKPSILRIGGCGWHGYINNGEIQTI